ncbi:uncharacterized protein LOC122870699 [Siniperca chuatsi]|uniref:uncharacterized protein LOC122870699 n=1 Tax=Siniperca chuatsi TaxID=119488 RepID=UPI001CE2046B|nr:uncharacterized protein LOC122870699 [Siniperca chuatsi]
MEAAPVLARPAPVTAMAQRPIVARRSCETRSSARRSDERRSPRRRSRESRSPRRRSDERRSPRWRSRESRSSTEESSPQRKKSSSAERLAKKLLETSAVQSLSEQSDLDAVVKTLAPALLAELAKMKSSSSSSSFSTAKKELTAKPSLQKSEETDSKKQKKPPQKQPATSSVSTPQTTKSTTTTIKVLLPTPNLPRLKGPLPPGAKKATAGKLTNQKIAAQGSVQKDPVTAAKIQTDAASASDASVASEPTAAAVREQQPAASTPSSTAVTPLTVGEMVEKHLDPKRIACLKLETCFSPKYFKRGKKQLLITGLPRYYDGCYTEDDVAKLLIPFGFQHKDENIYVVPQTCMAFIQMPTSENVLNIINVTARKAIFFKGSKLCFRVIANSITMTPFEFYKSLMKLMKSRVQDAGMKTVFIKNISPSETRDLREALRKISSVRNFLPLLNKVFIEFVFVRDADRLGVWYSLLKQAPGHEVHRISIPHRRCTSLPPKRPENALPDSKDAVAGATVPPIKVAIPQGSISPFWVAMRTSPFLFPTMSPWFIIPDYLTALGRKSIEKASRRGSMFPTIMLTGLPEGNYKHEDVAELVWQYFPKQNLHSLYYNVAVLTLQRRAFVFFADWTSCCDFVRDHNANRVSVKGCTLSVHFVLQHMNQESSEEMMYKSLMKWSNAGIPESKSLEERLLCVEISEVSVDVIRVVMEVVASIATFVSFLPLANRICVEMADSSGVTQVVEKYNTFLPDSPKKFETWSKVKRFETLKSLKQRLQDSSEITINFEPDTIDVKAKPPAVKSQTEPPPSELSDTGSQPALQAGGPGGSAIPEPITAGPSATAMEEDGEKPGTEIAMDSTVGPETNEDVEKVKGEEGSLITSVSTADVTSAVSSGNTVPAASSPAPSATALMPEENFAELPQINEDIFKALTAAVHQHRLTRGSRSKSEEKKSKDSSEPTKPSSSASVSKASSSSSPLSAETPSSPGQKTQQSKTKSSSKPSNTASSGCSSRSASAACEREKITSAPAVKASIETHLEPLREEAKDTEGAVAKADHKVSAQGFAAKTVESETKIETTSEMHPPPQRHEVALSQAQSLETDFNVNNIQDQKKSKEEGEEDDVVKHTEEEGDSENYQIIDSLDDQTDEQMDDGGQDDSSETQLTGPEEGQTLNEESYQVLDSADNESKARPEEYNEMEMDGSLKVLDSVTDDQAATGQEDSRLVQDDGSTVKQLSEEDAVPVVDRSDDAVKDAVGKDQETNNKDHFQVLDTGSKQAPRGKGDGKKKEQEEVKSKMLSAESCKASQDVENPDGRIPNEDQPLQDRDNKDTLRDPDSDVTEQETFEVLDSIDDQTATEDGSQKPETPSEQISKEDIRPVEQEEDTHQVIDSLKDQPTTTETESGTDNQEKRTKKGEATARKDDRPSKRSSPATSASKSEEKEKSPKKQDRTVKRYETRTKMDTTAGVSKKDKEVTEEMVYEIVDSVEDEPVKDASTTERSGRRRSARGKKDDKITLNLTEVSEKPEEATYKILDSVEDETADDEPTVTTRSTRGKRERATKKDALNEETKKENTPTRRRHTPARESQERNREKTPKKEEKAPPKYSTPTKQSAIVVREVSEEDATNEISSMEDEVKDDRPATGGKGKRGRPKKEVKTAKKDSGTLKKGDKDASEKAADEEEATYQILDSVEDETVADEPPQDSLRVREKRTFL